MANDVQLTTLVDAEQPDAVLAEVEELLSRVCPGTDPTPVREAFRDVVDVFDGRHPGYRACNLEYHNLKHTTDTFLAVARLVHGATVAGHSFSARHVVLALITAMLHDTGYIQVAEDKEGTGAKYTLTHIQRSAEFMKRYYAEKGIPEEEFEMSSAILHCTGLQVRISEIRFPSNETAMLGSMLGAADLLGQMSDRAYLEKLLFLYREFREGGIHNYVDERDLLEKTLGFYQMTKTRLAGDLGGVDRYMQDHFRDRWNVDRNLYRESIERHLGYLTAILRDSGSAYRGRLRRKGLVQKLEEEYDD